MLPQAIDSVSDNFNYFFYLDCKNVISEADCQRRMMMGECANNPVFMSLNCKYSCGYCSKKISFVLLWVVVWCMHMALYWPSGGQKRITAS